MSLASAPRGADLAPPTPGALQRAAGRHTAITRRRAAARRLAEEVAEARALGVAVVVKPTVDRTWAPEEDRAVAALYPDLDRLCQRLPHRSREAIRHRAVALDVVPRMPRWTPAEVATLRRIWTKASPAELAKALPRWGRAAVDRKARLLGLPPRGRPPLVLTGNALCDAIRDRCRVVGVTMAELDRMVGVSTYFQAHEWKNKRGHRIAPMARAVEALGGVLGVEWPD